jgi:hypothetical protein
VSELSVVTWNLHQAVDKRATNMARTWVYLANEIAPTVALVQEALVVPENVRGAVVSEAAPGYSTAVIGYGAAIQSLPAARSRFSSRHEFPTTATVPGTFAAAQIVEAAGARPIVFVSLYGLMAPVYAQIGILRAIADLIPLFDDRSLNVNVVVGGDLNAYDQSTDRVERARWKSILNLVESLGLVNLLKQTKSTRPLLATCPCDEEECWHVETFRNRNRRDHTGGYYTTDYLLATPQLASRLSDLRVINEPEVWEMSDHTPIVARFSL